MKKLFVALLTLVLTLVQPDPTSGMPLDLPPSSGARPTSTHVQAPPKPRQSK